MYKLVYIHFAHLENTHYSHVRRSQDSTGACSILFSRAQEHTSGNVTIHGPSCLLFWLCRAAAPLLCLCQCNSFLWRHSRQPALGSCALNRALEQDVRCLFQSASQVSQKALELLNLMLSVSSSSSFTAPGGPRGNQRPSLWEEHLEPR